MRAFSPHESHCSLREMLARLWRHWTAPPNDQLLEAARLGSGTLAYLSDGLSAATSSFCRLASGRDDDLVRHRMIALGLDPYELALSDPALLRHLQRCCRACENREACASHLARLSTDRGWKRRNDWRDYCENALTLEVLIALQSRTKPAPKYQFPYIC